MGFSSIWIFTYNNKKPPLATEPELNRYHSPEYIEYIRDYNSEKEHSMINEKFGVGISSDTPSFPNIYEFCQLTGGASLLAADVIASGKNDVVLNWMGGYHHAKKSKASGFCYVNDIVLSILRLLETFERVMYIDIDVHHGDGVEEAFYNCNRVMTMSLHQYDESIRFFPGTGNFDSCGVSEGLHYAVNVPLKPGCDDDTFIHLFNKTLDKAVSIYRPSVIWLQCGADSLIGDIIGRFRLSTKAHGEAVRKVLSKGIPTILGGGGGYTIENVARCWAYETSIAAGIELPDKLPDNLDFYDYYKNDPYLHIYDSSLSNTINNPEISYWKFNKDTAKQHVVYGDKSYMEGVLSETMNNLKKLEQIHVNGFNKGNNKNSFNIDPDIVKHFKGY